MSDRPLHGADELARLAEIARLGLADFELGDPELQRFVEEAAKRFDLPISLVSIVLDGAQYFLAQTGLGGWLEATGGTPREWAFCDNAVQTKETFVVEDATAHPMVKGNPLVENDGVRCYAGAPLLTSSGHALGTLCVIGASPREFSEPDLARLKELAQEVVAYLEARAAVD